MFLLGSGFKKECEGQRRLKNQTKTKHKGAREDEELEGRDKDEVVLQMRNYSGDASLSESRWRQL